MTDADAAGVEDETEVEPPEDVIDDLAGMGDGDAFGGDVERADHGEPEQGGGGGDRVGGLLEAATNTEPHDGLGEFDLDFDPDEGGMPRVQRGVEKFADGLGIGNPTKWAITDIVVGAGEMLAAEGGLPGANPGDGGGETGSNGPEAGPDMEGEFQVSPDDLEGV